MKVPSRQTVREWLLITVGVLCVAAGVYFFKFPNNFSTGGVSGLSVILAHCFPNLSQATVLFVINNTLLVLGFLCVGREFGIRTVYGSLLFSGSISVLEQLMPMTAPMTHEPLLELVFAVSIPAVGSAILFNLDASTGGTDIVAMILKKYTSLDLGKALMCSDCIIVLVSCVIFGMETGLYCILGLAAKSLLVDTVMENLHTNKYFHIVTDYRNEIEHFIIHELGRGCTALHGEGSYTHQGKTVLLTVVNRRQAIQLRRYVKSVDPHAFVLIMNSTEIIGKGFRGVN